MSLYTPIICLAIYSIFMSLATSTRGFKGAIVFKVIPFFLGLSSLLVVLKVMGFFS